MKSRITKDEVITELTLLYNKYKRLTIPLIESECTFSRRAIRTHFGSLKNFMSEYNIKNILPNPQKSTKGKSRKTWSKEEVIIELKNLEIEHGYVSKTLLEKIQKPSPKVIYRIWENYESMYTETGIKQRPNENITYTKNDLVIELLRLYNKYGFITCDIITFHSTISLPIFYREFNNIENMHTIIDAHYRREHYLSKSSQVIIKIAETYFGETAILEFKDDRIRNPKTNRQLRIDAYFPKINLAIEIHGLQHYTRKSYFFKNENQFKYRISLDRLKRMQLKKYGYKYLEIKYSLSENKIIQLLSNFN